MTSLFPSPSQPVHALLCTTIDRSEPYLNGFLDSCASLAAQVDLSGGSRTDHSLKGVVVSAVWLWPVCLGLLPHKKSVNVLLVCQHFLGVYNLFRKDLCPKQRGLSVALEFNSDNAEIGRRGIRCRCMSQMDVGVRGGAEAEVAAEVEVEEGRGPHESARIDRASAHLSSRQQGSGKFNYPQKARTEEWETGNNSAPAKLCALTASRANDSPSRTGK